MVNGTSLPLTGRVSIPKSVLFALLGTCGLTLNLLVLFCLRKCKDLNFLTKMLMMLQCSVNSMGLLVHSLNGAVVMATGVQFPASSGLISRVPGALGLITTYTQFGLQFTMAVNRYTAICTHQKYPTRFSKDRSRLYAGICLLYGICNACMCLFPCCAVIFHPVMHKWMYVGTGRKIRILLTFANDLVVFPTLVFCYGKALLKVRKTRLRIGDQAKVTTAQINEFRILFQFAAVSGVWFLYAFCFRGLYLYQHLTSVIILSEVLRFAYVMVDPIVYLGFNSDLQKRVKQALWLETGDTVLQVL